jgi:hypothetical protein
MNDKSRLVVLLILLGLALFVLASPLGDWLGGYLRKDSWRGQYRVEHFAPPLTVLKLKRDVVKGVSPSELEVPNAIVPKAPRSGTLNNLEIEEAIQQRQTSFQRCWTQRLKETAGLAGRVVLQFEIVPRGRVQNVLVAESTIKDEIMTRCLISVLERIQFREFSDGPVTLTFPLSFE